MNAKFDLNDEFEKQILSPTDRLLRKVNFSAEQNKIILNSYSVYLLPVIAVLFLSWSPHVTDSTLGTYV